jgi:hypothetical protein
MNIHQFLVHQKRVWDRLPGGSFRVMALVEKQIKKLLAGRLGMPTII